MFPGNGCLCALTSSSATVSLNIPISNNSDPRNVAGENHLPTKSTAGSCVSTENLQKRVRLASGRVLAIVAPSFIGFLQLIDSIDCLPFPSKTVKQGDPQQALQPSLIGSFEYIDRWQPVLLVLVCDGTMKQSLKIPEVTERANSPSIKL